MADLTSVEGPEAAAGDAGIVGESDLLAALCAGTVIEGKYRVDEIIGRGGMGVVAAATHVHLGERVALKFLLVGEEQGGVDFRARFALEARVCARLRNEHIARVQDVGIWQGKVPFMVMEYLQGVDSRRLLRRGAKLPVEQAVEYVVQVCEGLAEAHAQGIVHRDLKPPNIFLTKRPDGSDLVKVLDFGISKWTSADEQVGELTKTGVMLGSPKYMSPEQLNGDAVDARADIWSIGAVLYLMLTGRPPHDYPQMIQTFMAISSGVKPAPPSALEPAIPPALDAVVLRCLTREKDARVQDVAELAGALLEAVGSPFAGQARAQIGAVLAPVAVPSVAAGALSMTTGSHAVFSVGSTRASPMPATMEARAPSSRPRGAGKSRFVVPAAVVALAITGLFAVTQAPRPASENAGAAASVSAPAAKSVVSKRLVREGATALVRGSGVTSGPFRAPAHAAPRAPARAVAASPGATALVAPLQTKPDTAPAPAIARASNPLEDRQ